MNFETIGGQYSPQAQIVAMDAAIQKKVSMILDLAARSEGHSALIPEGKGGGHPDPRDLVAGRAEHRRQLHVQRPAGRGADRGDGGRELKKEGKSCAVGIIQGIPVVNILNARNLGMAAGRQGRRLHDPRAAGKPDRQQLGRLPDRPGVEDEVRLEDDGDLRLQRPERRGRDRRAGRELPAARHGHERRPPGNQLVKSGAMFADGAVPNVEVGESMAQVASDIVTGKPYPKTVWFKFGILTKRT